MASRTRAAGTVALAVGAILILASMPTASAAPALVVKDLSCSILDGNGETAVVVESLTVDTNSKNRVTIFTCRGTVTPPPDGKALVLDNLFCFSGVTSQFSFKGRLVISAAGQATLVCPITPNAVPTP